MKIDRTVSGSRPQTRMMVFSGSLDTTRVPSDAGEGDDHMLGKDPGFTCARSPGRNGTSQSVTTSPRYHDDALQYTSSVDITAPALPWAP